MCDPILSCNVFFCPQFRNDLISCLPRVAKHPHLALASEYPLKAKCSIMPLYNCFMKCKILLMPVPILCLYAIGVRSTPSVKTKHNSAINFYTILDIYGLSFLVWWLLLHLWRAMAHGLGILHFCIPSLLVRFVHEFVEPIIYHDSDPQP
jgi:hypothetical protein